MAPMNVTEALLYQCKLNPLAPAVLISGQPAITYRELEQLILRAAGRAIREGIEPRAIAGLLVADTLLHLVLTLALMRLGAVTVSLRQVSDAMVCHPGVIMSDRQLSVPAGIHTLIVDASWLTEGASTDIPGERYATSANDLCRIILTSGSTGTPKAVPFTHAALNARVAHNTYSKGPRFAHCERFFCDISMSTSPGIQFILSLLGRGAMVSFLGEDPADILQSLDLYKITGMATTPYSLSEYLSFYESDKAFNPHLTHIICQGAMLSGELSRRARSRMCQNIYSSYGSTETTTVAFGPAGFLETIPGAVGQILPGAVIEIMDAQGVARPAMEEGAIRIRGRYMADGYFEDDESTKASFQDGYFLSGDIGYKTPENLLVITGREKTALNIGGDTIKPELIEQVLCSFPGIRAAGVTVLSDQFGVDRPVALILASQAFDEAALKQYCEQRLPRYGVPERYLGVNELPQSQGKVERKRFAEVAMAVMAGRRGA